MTERIDIRIGGPGTDPADDANMASVSLACALRRLPTGEELRELSAYLVQVATKIGTLAEKTR